MDIWTECLENGGQIDVIYTDLEKAFDKISHKHLVSKLHSYGLNLEVIQWIKAFLTDRKQRVRINNAFSMWILVDSGIPQGSILGPILFITYINDLVECDCGSELFLYADDAKMFKHVRSETDMDIWLLSLNIGKCNTVSYGRKPVQTTSYAIYIYISDVTLQQSH